MMGHDPVTIDALIERTGAPAEAITAGLVRLELDALVCALPGGYWQRQ
jgi:DNA processing protein